MEGERKTIFNSFTLAILLLMLASVLYFYSASSSPYVSVTFYDVGQGDAALISTPQGQNILIDGGPNDSIVEKLSEDIPFYHKKIDAIILSHPHADHLDGLIPVLKEYEVSSLYLTGVLHSTPEYLEFLQILKEKNIRTHSIFAGNNLDLGDDIKIETYFPLSDLYGQKVENLNNSSVVSKLVWGKSKVLFTGDLEKEAQVQLLATKPDLQADLLKIPHHGSKDSANPDFLKTVSPKYAVISVGKDNQFGHPAGSHLKLLKNIQTFRTDQDGDVRFRVTKERIVPTKNDNKN